MDERQRKELADSTLFIRALWRNAFGHTTKERSHMNDAEKKELADTIIKVAKQELKHEEIRKQIEETKEAIRAARRARRWWHKLFPWRITVKRR